MDKKINSKGLNLIKKFEGYRPKAYLDPVGILTVGYGHVVKTEERDLISKDLTADQCEQLLKKDCRSAEKSVSKLVKVPLSDNQFSALVSLVFNIGEGNFKGSTLLRLLNEKKYKEAAEQFVRWNKGRVDGELVELAGLTKRRTEERSLFLTPDEEQPTNEKIRP